MPPAECSVDNLDRIKAAVDICARYGVKPALLITYPVANSTIGQRVLTPLLEADLCILGAQLHPWVTPPYSEEKIASNSYPCNLPRDLEAEKLDSLFNKIQKNFGVKPEVYKAGRYGISLSRTPLLAERGVRVDTSVMPHASYVSDADGPDFFGLPDEPFWLDREAGLLAVPSTQGILGSFGRLLAPSAHRALLSPRAQRWMLPAVLSRLGLLERIRLSPEGCNLAAQYRLIDSRLGEGKRHFVLTFHSPSLAPGNTPYTKSTKDVEAFLRQFDATLSYMIKSKHFHPVSCFDIYHEHEDILSHRKRQSDNGEDKERALPERILMVSGFMPPRAPVGAVRPAALMNHWREKGVDVRAIALDTGEYPRDPASDERGIIYLPHQTPGTWVSALAQRLRHLRKTKVIQTPDRRDASTRPEPKALGFRMLYRGLVAFPDRYRTWITPAADAGIRMAKDWRPDLIYSSGPPQSGHVVARKISKRLNIPWIAEQRDLWVGNPYEERHPWITPFYDSFGEQTLADAAGAVVVTEGAARHMQAIYTGPVVISYNGYTESDFAGLEFVDPYDPEKLTILHAGVIYAARRDPGPLFAAIAQSDLKGKIRCLFFHDAEDQVAALAEKWGIRDSVEIYPAVPRREMLRLERQVDLLLECRWMNPSSDGVIPGKLFEYIGAQRPVLSLGSLTAEAANIARKQRLGLVSNNPSDIAAYLKKLWETKQISGRIPDINNPTASLFARMPQFEKICRLIHETVNHQ